MKSVSSLQRGDSGLQYLQVFECYCVFMTSVAVHISEKYCPVGQT